MLPANRQEEMEYVELLAAEKHQAEALKHMQHQNKSLSVLDEILEDVRRAADRLEEEIEEHAFDDNKSVSWGCAVRLMCDQEGGTRHVLLPLMGHSSGAGLWLTLLLPHLQLHGKTRGVLTPLFVSPFRPSSATTAAALGSYQTPTPPRYPLDS